MFGIKLGQKAVDDVLDPEKGHLAKVGKWIGKQKYTEEEKAVAVSGLMESVRQFSLDVASQSTERSKLTRNIAVLWIVVQLGMILGWALSIFPDDPKYKEHFWQVATSDVLVFGTFGVMTYFFGAYGYGRYLKGVGSKSKVG